MKVQIINDKLGHFEYDINSIEQDGYEVFKYAEMTFGSWSWNEYQVYHDGEILQTVINPHILQLKDII